MDTICTTFFHDTLGKLRTVYTGGDLLFCIYDISKILGYGDDGKSIRRFCANMQKHEYGRKTLNFMDAGDMDHLFSRIHSDTADELHCWICYTIIPEVTKTDDEYIESAYPSDEEELYLIHRSDYDNLTFAFAAMCHNLLKLCNMAEKLPATKSHTVIKERADTSKYVCEHILEKYGLSAEDMVNLNSEKVFSLLDEDVISPEEAGYVAYDQVVEAFGQMAADFLTDWKHHQE